ncbi:MAG: hypothetical protein AAB542_02725 [Patescibacteria group bacterium]
MLYLLHGDQPEALRNKLMELKNSAQGKEVRDVDGKHIDATSLLQALESSSLFGSDVLVVIEGFISNAKKREKAFAVTLAKVLEASTAADVILYEEKEVDKTTVSKLGPRTQITLCKTPGVIFQFLDSLRPGNEKTSLAYFSQTVAHTASEIVFVLLVRRVRQLIQLSDGIAPEGLQGWQAGRLTAQSRHFTMEQLVAMHKDVLEIDIAIKTGASPFTLTQLLEQFIIKL